MRLKIVVAWGLLTSLVLAAEPVPPATEPSVAAAASELGLPFFDAFAPQDYRGHSQVWSAVEDAAGLTYFGNYGRVVVYDGARWDYIEVPGTSFVRALAVDAGDTLWIGAVNELGYARTDATGRRTFVSLKDKLPAAVGSFGEIWRVVLTPRGPVFQTNTWLMRWNGDSFTTCALPPSGAWQLVRAGDTLWVTHNQQGWFTLEENAGVLSLAPFARPPEIAASLVFAVRGDRAGEWIFGTGRFGLLRWDGRTFTPFPTGADEVLRQKGAYRGTRLPDGRFAISTRQAGVILLDAQGGLLAQLDEDAGMPDNGALNVFASRTGVLWACLQRGMVRVDMRPWVSWFGPARGAPRVMVQPPARYQGVLYTATDSGLMRLAPATATAPARLVPVPEFPEFINGVAPAEDALIVLAETAILEWRDGRRTKLPGVIQNIFGFVPVQDQPHRWFALADEGLRSYRYRNGEWHDEGFIPELVAVRSAAAEDNGTWWFGTPSSGVMRVTFPRPQSDGPGKPVITRFTAGHGLPAGHGWARVSVDARGPLLRCEKGFFRFDAATQNFEPTAEFGARFANGSTTARSILFADDRDGVWMVARPAGEAELVTAMEFGVHGPKGWKALNLPQLARLDDVSGFEYEKAADLLWVGGQAGLVRLDLARWREAAPEPLPVVSLRSVEAGAGQRLPLAGGWDLPYERRSLSVRFAAPALAGDAAALYESTLLGDGEPVVFADGQPRREFSALASGHYALRLRARGGDGRWSEPVTVAFTIRPPWWFSGWAWAGYAVAALLLVALFIRSRTQALRRRAAELEATVAARTEELRQSNLELVRLNKLELDEKIAARLAEEKARLEVLRYQLNPHFLFNALTSVCAQLPPSLSGARDMIERLTDFCQMTLFRPANDESPTLGQEMKMLRAYLDIEQTRWGDLLEVVVDVEAAAGDTKIPSLLLLPLVENALKYGQATSRDRLRVRLAARREPGGAVLIEVANTGHWVAPTERGVVPSLGIGHENLRQRLQRYYPGAHEFTTVAADGWVTVRLVLRMPLKE